MRSLALPENLVQAAAEEGRAGWLETLPATVQTLEARWSLTVGDPYQPGGSTAWVAPARHVGGAELVLKLAWPHPEATDEAKGLRAWQGDGAVRLFESCDLGHTVALLLERCLPGTALGLRAEDDQDVVIAGLLRRLWRHRPASKEFQPLEAMCARWAARFEARVASGRRPLDPGLCRTGVALFRALPGSAERRVLLCTDLHAGNVLAAQREPWLMIDPKPYEGDPTYDVLQHLLNCDRRLRTDPHGLVRRLADLLDVDGERLLLWLFARCVVESPDWPGLGAVARRIAPP